MKKAIILLLLIAAGLTPSVAQSMLKVSLADRTPVNVSVDGRYFNKGGSSVTVGDLPPGRHYLKIFVITQDRRGRGREDVVYEGGIKTHQGSITLFVFDANTGKKDIDEQDMNNYLSSIPPDNNTSSNGNMNNGSYGNNTPMPVMAHSSLTNDKVGRLKDMVAAKDADTQKMDALKDALKNETYTTDQVSNMMDWFIFENSKVTFVEWAYPNTVDKENFRNLENKFSYKNSQDDLEQFLKGSK